MAVIIDFRKEAAKRGKDVEAKATKPRAKATKDNVAPKAKAAPRTKSAAKVNQAIENGSNNTQIVGDNNTFNFKGKSGPKVQILPSAESIGGNPDIKTSILERFNRLGEEREKRFGKSAYQVMYGKFKSDFGIKSGAWTIIWNWPIERAGAIINYLDALYDNTIQGRKEKAFKKEGRIPSKPHLFKRETELLAFLGYTTKSPEVKQMLQERFRVTSHAHLTQAQLWQLVCHLEGLVKKMVGE